VLQPNKKAIHTDRTCWGRSNWANIL